MDKKIVHLSTPAVQTLSFVHSIFVAYFAWSVIGRQIMSRRSEWYSADRGKTCLIVAYTLVIGGTIMMYRA